MLKKIFIAIFLLIAGFVLWQFELVSYTIRQAKGQITIVLNAEPISKALQNSDYPDSLKRKLILVEEIRRFAVDSLGLKNSKNYTTVFNQHGRSLMFVVTACEPYCFKAYEWKFPLLGKFPYKGFFDLNAAKKEEQRLIAAGYDTDLGSTSGWSTLGWLKDPILSNMLYRSEGDLAELIIHELTHGTLYVKDSASFNENLAQFVGVEGAKRFLVLKYGVDSPFYLNYSQSLIDEKRYTKHIFNGFTRLNTLYKGFAFIRKQQKDSLKKASIQTIAEDIDTVKFFNKVRYVKRMKHTALNNAYFMEFRRYEEKQNTLKDTLLLRFNGNIKAHLNFLKGKYPSL